MNPQLELMLGRLQTAGLLQGEVDGNFNVLHAQLQGQATQVANILTQGNGKGGAVDPEAAKQFLLWIAADKADLVSLQSKLALFSPRLPGRVQGEDLENLLPAHSALGVDKFGHRVDPATFNFNRVSPALSPHEMIFAVNVRGHAILDHAEEVLRRARTDITFNRFFIASRNRADEYLNLINYLLPRTPAQAASMTDEDVYLIWESLARVDAEVGGNPGILVNNRLHGVQRLAEQFLTETGLQPMSQPALAQTDGRLVIGGMAAGVGAIWSDEVPALIEKPAVNELYQALRPSFVQEGVEDPEVLRVLEPTTPDSPETHATWLRVNGVVHNMPATDLVQILRARDLQSYGVDNAAFGATAGQSAGQIRALGMGRAFRQTDAELLLPKGAGGFQTVAELDREIRFDLRESSWYQYYIPEGKLLGAQLGMSISGIPYGARADLPSSPLGRIIAAINSHCGANDHIVASNMTAPAPHYFAVIAGTTNPLMALQLMIYNFRRQAKTLAEGETPPKYTPEAERIVRESLGEVIPIFATINPKGVLAPNDSVEIGLTIPPHDPVVLGPGRDSFVAEMERRGITLATPVTTVISHTFGEPLTAVAERDGISLTQAHANDQYMNEVWLPEIARGFGDAGVHLIFGFGPTATAEGFLRKNDVGVPVLALAKDDGWQVATTRDPRVLEAALGVADTSTIFLPGGGNVRMTSKGEVQVTHAPATAVVSAGATGFEGIRNVSVNREDVGEGNTRVRVDVRGNVAEADLARFQAAFFNQGQGRVPFLFSPEQMLRDGAELPNPFHALLTPRAGWSYEFLVNNTGAVADIRIFEQGRLALQVARGIGEKSVYVVAQEYLDTPHGRSVLNRYYGVDEVSIIDHNTGPEWRESAREAYKTDWGVDSVAGAREVLATKASPDFLQKFKLTYNYQTSAEDMAAYARTMGIGSAYPVGYLKDRVLGKLDLMAFLADALDLDPTRILNMGGAESIEEDELGHPLFQVGQNVTVNVYITNVEDIHEGARQGRRVRVYVEGRNEAGQLLARGVPTILDLRSNDVPSGEVRDVFMPRTDLPTTVDPLANKKVHVLPQSRVVARGTVTVPPGVPAAFVDDAQRRHTSEVSSLLASDGQMGAIAQGEVTYNLGINEVLQAPLTTAGQTSRYRGFSGRTFDQPVTPGETLSYEVRRIRHGQGLHEYQAVFRNASNDDVMSFTYYDRARPRKFIWGGQGALEEGSGDLVRRDPTRAAILDRLQGYVTDAGYGINLTAALNAGVTDTALAQPAQAAFVIPYWLQAQDAGLIPDDAEHAGLSLGSWLAMYGAGYLGEATLVPGLARRGAEMGALVDNKSGMGVVQKFKGTRAEADALCAEASSPRQNVAISNYNTRRQFTVSGDLKAIDRFITLVNNRKLGEARRFDEVKTPFHHPKLRPASDKMRPMMKTQGIFAHPVRARPQPVFMDTTLRYHDAANPDQIADDFADQISTGTDFAGVSTKFLGDGAREFVEVNAAPTLTKLVYSEARSSGLDPDAELRLMQVSPDVDPETYGFFTYDAEGLDAPAAAVVAGDSPAAVGPDAPDASAPPLPPPSTPQPVAEVRGPVALPEWTTMSPAEFRGIQTSLASGLIGRLVSPDNVAVPGATPLFGVVTQATNSIDVKETDTYKMLARLMLPVEYEAALKNPGAIEVLTAHVAYLRGLLAEGGPPVTSLVWADGTQEEILQILGHVWETNSDVGQFKYNPANLAMDADFSDKGPKPIGISSKKATNALRMLSIVFGVNISKKEAEKFANVGLIVKAIEHKLKSQADILPSGRSMERHFLTLELLAEEQALVLLEADKAAADKAAQRSVAGGGGMSAEEMAEMEGRMTGQFEAALATREDEFQRAARASLVAAAKAFGVDLTPANIAQVTITRAGQIVPVDKVQATRDAQALAEVTDMVSPDVVAAAHPSYNPALEYTFADVSKHGADGQILRFVVDLRAGNLANPDTRRERIAVLANQMDPIRLEHLRGRRDMLTDAGELAVMDELISRAEEVLADGPQFDGVIGVRSAYHRPIYGTKGTELVDRGRTLDENFTAYEAAGLPKSSLTNLKNLIRHGADLRGMDFCISAATGSAGAAIAIDLARLGGRIIVLDYRGRSSANRAGRGFRSDFYRTLRSENGVAGLPADQIVVEPYFTQGNDVDLSKLVSHFWDKGYRIRGFFHTAAVSDYGAIEEKGRPYDMDRVHVEFPLAFEKAIAISYRDHEAELKAEFFAQHKAEFDPVKVNRLPASLQAKYAGQETVLAMSSGNVEGQSELLPLDEAFWFVMVSERLPSPNDHNQLVGSGNYGRKSGAAAGASSENLFNSGVTWSNGDPIEIEDQHLTGAIYPPEGLPAEQIVSGEDDKKHLMEDAARMQLGFEEVARDEYKVPFYGMQPSEGAAIIIADKVDLWTRGPRAYRHKPAVLVSGEAVRRANPTVTREHDMTVGFRGLAEASAKRGEVVGTFAEKVGAREAARHATAARFVVPPATDAVHLPVDGSTNDPNYAVFEQTVIDGETTGDFSARPTDIYPRRHTMMTVGHATLNTGGASTLGATRYRLSRTGVIGLPDSMGWLTTPDRFDQAKGMGLNVDGLSKEQIDATHGRTFATKTGAQRLPDATRFEYTVQVDLGRVQFEVSDMDQARAYEAAGATLRYPTFDGKIEVTLPEGATVGVKAIAQFATDVIVDLPGGADNFHYEVYGATNGTDASEKSNSKRMGTVAEGGAYATAGETPASFNEQFGRSRRIGIKTLAGPEPQAVLEMVLNPKANKEVTGDAMAAHLLEGWGGQSSIEPTGTNYTGGRWCVPGACSSGNLADTLASNLVNAAYFVVEHQGVPASTIPAVVDIGNADDFGTYYGFAAFIAAGALITYERAAELDLAPNQWSRPNDVGVRGFVPGRGAADVLEMPAEFTEGRMWRTGVIGTGGNPPDGLDEGAREAYGQGLILTAFRTWVQSRTYIPGETDRDKMNNIELIIQGHMTSTPLGDAFENLVKNLFLRWAGVESKAEFYQPGDDLYLGYTSFEEMVGDIVGAKGPDGIKALNAYLEKNIPDELKATFGRDPADPAYTGESKTDLGHELGAASLHDKAEVQTMAAFNVVPGNASYDNLRVEAANDPYLLHVNDALYLPAVTTSHRPKVYMSLAAGFSRNNTSRAEAEMRRHYATREEAIVAKAAEVRQWAVERAQLRSIREGKRPQVAGATAMPYPYTEYQDLRFLRGKSLAIVQHMFRTGQRLDFDHIMDWAVNPNLAWDTDAVVRRVDRAVEAGYRRIEEIEAEALQKPELALARARAAELNIAEQPHLYLGGSEGQALQTLVFDILSGEVKQAVVVHKDGEGTPPYYNAQALKAWAAAHGATLEIANANAVIFDSSSVAFNKGMTPATADWNNLTPEDIAWDKLKYNALDSTVLRAIKTVGDRTGNQPNWVIKNFIAWGAPERAPGAGKIQVPSIDPDGRLFMATIEDVETWDDAIQRTIGSMGFNHWAIIQHALDMGLIDKETAFQIVAYPFFFSGASRKIGDGAAVLFGLEQMAVLGDDWVSISGLAAQASLGLLQSQVRAGKGMVVQADWQNGLNPKAMPGVYYGTKESGLASLGIAKLIAVLATKHVRDQAGTEQPALKVEVDQHEARAIDATYDAMKDLGTQIADWIAANPTLVQTDASGRQVIPTEASLALLGKNIPANALDMLSQYQPADLRKTRALATGPSPIHNGEPSINPNFAVATVTGEVEFTSASTATVATHVPENYAGYSGVAHGGRIDGLFEAAMLKAQAAHPMEDFDVARMPRSVEYLANVTAGSDVTIHIDRWPNVGTEARTIVMRMVGADGTELARAAYSAARTWPMRNGEIHVSVIDTDATAVKDFSTPVTADLKPHQLEANREFGCLPHCAAAGHTHESGLQFKYAFDAENNALWGVFDATDDPEKNIQGIMLAADDMAAWTGLRASKMWGFTTNNYFIPLRAIQPGERLFLVSRIPQVGDATDFDAQIRVMNADGEIVGLFQAEFFPTEKASISGLKGALQALALAPQGDTRAAATLQFLRESMGRHYKEMEMKAQFQIAQDARRARLGLPAPVVAGSVADRNARLGTVYGPLALATQAKIRDEMGFARRVGDDRHQMQPGDVVQFNGEYPENLGRAVQRAKATSAHPERYADLPAAIILREGRPWAAHFATRQHGGPFFTLMRPGELETMDEVLAELAAPAPVESLDRAREEEAARDRDLRGVDGGSPVLPAAGADAPVDVADGARVVDEGKDGSGEGGGGTPSNSFADHPPSTIHHSPGILQQSEADRIMSQASFSPNGTLALARDKSTASKATGEKAMPRNAALGGRAALAWMARLQETANNSVVTAPVRHSSVATTHHSSHGTHDPHHHAHSNGLTAGIHERAAADANLWATTGEGAGVAGMEAFLVVE